MSLQGFIEQVCSQTAVYWGNPRAGSAGDMVWDDPVEVKVRWDNVTKLIRDAKGKEVACRAEVLLAGQLEEDGTVTPIDLDVDGRLYLGSLDDLDSGQEDDPLLVDGTWAIMRFDKTPEFGSTEDFVRTAFL